jgi:AraC-like DNA-binding protein
MDRFSFSTGIGLIAFDKQLNVIASRPDKTIASNFLLLDTGHFIDFLSGIMDKDIKEIEEVYTFVFPENFACAVVPVVREEKYIGSFVTAPIFLQKKTFDFIEKLSLKITALGSKPEAVKDFLRRMPERNLETLRSLGETLFRLSTSIISNFVPVMHTMVGTVPEESDDTLELFSADSTTYSFDPDFGVRQLRPHYYQSLKDAIQTSQVSAAEAVAQKIYNNFPTQQLDSGDYLASLRESFIKISSMVCALAIEAEAPYFKCLDTLDEQIRLSTALNNTYEIFELMKKTFSAFTRLSSVGRIQAYSRPVKQSLDYIAANYDKKVTLEILAEHTGLSTFYLSSLLKKETGKSLSSHINLARIDAAKRLLIEGGSNIIDIAQQLGFSSHNHFSNTFKKYTGQTPSDFLKANTIRDEDEENKSPSAAGTRAVLKQVNSILAAMPDLFDAARVVDPRTNTFFSLKASFCDDKGDMLSGTCFDHWGRNAICENCISRKAFLENRTVFKIEHKVDEGYFVWAVPKILNGELYIVELLKRIDEKAMSECLRVNSEYSGLFSAENSILQMIDNPDEERFLDRKAFEKRMGYCVRHCQIANLPLSIVALICDDFASEDAFTAATLQIQSILAHQAHVESMRIKNSCCFAGNYSGDIFVLALGGAGEDALAASLADIKENIQSLTFDLRKEKQPFDFHFSAFTYKDAIPRADEIRRALLAKLSESMRPSSSD